MLSLLILALVSDTAPIHTTAADSSHVAFIAQTPLTWEMFEHDSLRYIRFTGTSVSDSIGFPELPMITCLIAVPDSVTPALEFAMSTIMEETVNPVYPVPAQILSDQYSTVAIVDSFVQDSTAYLSDEFWPAERVRIIGETRICDQRLLKIQLFPAQYRASDSTLSTVSSFSVSVSFDSASAVWSDIGLGAFQRMVSGSPIIGYHSVDQTHAPVPVYFGKVDPENGPSRMPDYVIICASGLFDQCEDAIEDLAEHRVNLNGFDVALVTTDDIVDDFDQSGATEITEELIRNFTEHMWNNWAQASIKKPEYLLLIGDHEDASYYDQDWFLPTHEYDDYIGLSFIENIGNDEWYAYFNDDTDINNDFPDMMVGRLSVKNGSTIQTDTLSTLIQNLIDLEDPIQQVPLVDNRRRILRLTGTGDDDGTGYQTPKDWGPGTGWTLAFTDWLGYDYSTNYCGDGREFTTGDGSTLWSEEWVDDCIYEFKKGAGVAFYSDHGEYHMFSAGLEWLDIYIPQDLHTMGSRDSTFNNYQIEQNLQTPSINYAAPFVLQLCCSSGTYNHTLQRHNDRTSHREFCYYDGWGAPPIPPLYNFGSDCLAEKMFKNTAVPVAGVFASSQPSAINDYQWYGKGILEGIYAQGFGRLGDAIASARTINIDYFESFGGGYKVGIAQFNLLGDPALDISDRVRYPDMCDLEIYTNDINISQYPQETVTGMDIPITFTVQNNGNQESDEYDVRITITHGQSAIFRYLNNCDEIPAREITVHEYTYSPSTLNFPLEVTVQIEVDYNEDCNDSWWGNNTASASVQLNDTYPSESGWPIVADGVINTTPILVNLDSDQDLEIIALTGTSLTAFDTDGDGLWEVTGENFLYDVHPMAADLDEDGNIELLLACGDEEIKVISHQGDLLYTLEDASEIFAVGNMFRSDGLELCVATGNSLDLYSWDSSNDEFDLITSKDFGYPMTRNSISLVCADLGGSQTYQDVAYLNGGFVPDGSTPQPEKKTIEVYNWSTSSSVYSKTWDEYVNSVDLAAGTLAGITSIGYPAMSYNGSSGDPAQIIEPGETVEEISCSNTNVLQTNRLIQGVFADWTAVAGADTYVLPSERQCLAWDKLGQRISGFPTDEFSGASLGSLISPVSLGDLNGDGEADVLFSTEFSGDNNFLAYNSDGDPLDVNLSFPYILPEDVSALGGFAIADIDRDGKVEMIFGTSEGLLHCWELGSCATDYAPWPQFQHDAGRTGVLE